MDINFKGIASVLGNGLKYQLKHPAIYQISLASALVSGIRTKGDIKSMTNAGINTMVGMMAYNVTINIVDIVKKDDE